MRKIWQIPGGIHPPENKSQSLQAPIGNIALPEELVLPLNQHIGAAAQPIVAIGDRVLTGQTIATAKGVVSAPVHAPTSGEIVAIEPRAIPHISGMVEPCIVLHPDGEDKWIELQTCADYTQLSPDQLLQKIHDAGVAGMGGAGFPTAVKLNPHAHHTIDTLIINGTECEPYISADDILMQTHAEEIIAGTQLLAHLLNYPDNMLIGIEDNKPKAIEAMQTAAATVNNKTNRQHAQIEICTFPTKYPSGGEKQLIQILTGREVPSGDIPASIGVVCQNIGSTQAAWRAVRFGEPLISRITTVVGEALDKQRNINVRLGTPITHILAAHGFDTTKGSRLIMGGPMMGITLATAEVPVVKTTNCILAPSQKELPLPPPAQACIRCGMCTEACPASLLPQQLYWYAQAQDYEKLDAHSLFDCIECGACSYVCPSNIPLVQYYRASKDKMRQLQTEKEKADRARLRFEFRQERIAKAEAEKEAKREARKKAAEEAKKKLAAQTTDEPRPATQESDLVAAAMARVQAKQVSPAQQQAKLERALSSAANRLSRAQQHLDDAAEDQKEKLQARVNEAEVKHLDAKNKLDAFFATSTTTASTTTASTTTAPQDAASNAIEKAKANIAAQADLTPGEKLRNQVQSLQTRLEKAQLRLQKAERENDENLEAFRSSVEKLTAKLTKTQQQLTQLTSD